MRSLVCFRQASGPRGGTAAVRYGTTGADERSTSLLVIAILAFRVLFTAAPFAVLVHAEGGTPMVPLVLGMASITLSAIMLGYLARGADLSASGFYPLLAADLVLSCSVGLSASTLPPDSAVPFHEVLWFPFHGTVMLWTVLLGVAWGCASVAVGVGLFLALLTGQHVGEPGTLPLVLSHAVWLTLPLGIAVAASVLLRRIVRAVLVHGVRVGRSDEQVQITRTLHDTVLQTLESIAKFPAEDREAPNERLHQLRGVAARQAAELRQLLRMRSPSAPSPLASMLHALVPEFAGKGLHVELVLDDFGDHDVEPVAQTAICEATREALANVVKHGGVRKAVVRARLTGAGLEVIIRDRGRGFEFDGRGPGFGIRESLVARMRDAGGDAEIWSMPSQGTRVRLTVPRW